MNNNHRNGETPVNLDWLRNPLPAVLTPFQKFVRSVDWSKTDLGPLQTWDQALRQTVRLMMADTSPVVLYWGANNTIIYNEAYVPLIGARHPSVMGQKAPDVFPEFWYHFEDIIAQMRQTGQTVCGDASRLLMVRSGFLEETFFDWKLIPVIGEDGHMLGSYGVPSDMTYPVIQERRERCIQALAKSTSQAISFTGLWAALLDSLAEDENDVPFAMLLADESSLGYGPISVDHAYKVVSSAGLPTDHPWQNDTANSEQQVKGLESIVLDAVASGHCMMIPADDARIVDHVAGLRYKGSGQPSVQFVALPIATGHQTPPVLFIGLNPNRRYNLFYERFLQLISDTLSSSLSKLRLSEELKHRAEMATKAARDFERSEVRFSRFATRSSVGLAVTDLEGKILYANSTWYDFSGIDPSTPHVHWRESVFEDDLPIVEDWWRKIAVLKQSGSFTFRSPASFSSGDMYMPHRTGLCACYADADEVGGIETIMALVVDISEQKWIENQLLQRTRELELSDQRYRKFADLCPLGIVSTDANGYVQWGNDAWHAFYNFKKGEVLDAQPWLPYIHDDDVVAAEDFFRDLQTKRGHVTVELRLKRKYVIYEGEKTRENDLVVIATGIQEYRPDGTVDHIDFIVTDISAQKMAEKILTEKMEEAIRNRNQQERFIDMISHEIRNPLSAILHCAEEIVDSTKKCLAHTRSNSLLSIWPSNSDRNPQPAEDLLHSALEAANTVLYCVHHQKQIVDDVLTLSKLDSELLIVSPVPVKLSDIIMSAVKIFEPEMRMSEISLETVEHESIAKNNIDWLSLDPNRFLQIVINLITNAIKFTRTSTVRRIKLTTSVHTKPPCTFEDLDYVPRRYENLHKKNAFAPKGDCHANNTIYLRVSVSDTGKGLTSDEKRLLFNRFAQASPKTHAQYGGSGLGLFISRQITEMLGGEIGVGSSPSGGCIFAFYVATSKTEPVLMRNKPSQTSVLATPARTMSAPSNIETIESLKNHNRTPRSILGLSRPSTPDARRILVVEDNVVNQKVLCKQLKNRGFDVEAANHGKEALLMLEQISKGSNIQYHCILMDVEMPIMGGIEATKRIRQLEAEGHLHGHVPIIGVTANVRSQQVETCLAAGMDDITTKPYRIDDLITHIDKSCSSENLAR